MNILLLLFLLSNVLGNPICNCTHIKSNKEINVKYNMNTTLGYGAQKNTMLFDALGFISGDKNADTFLPPGKVVDYFGFQYLRDNDLSSNGHNTDFLTKAANCFFTAIGGFNSSIGQKLFDLAISQYIRINQLGMMRLTPIEIFRNYSELQINKTKLEQWGKDFWTLDGELAIERAKTYGEIILSFTTDQKNYFNTKIKEKGMIDWPNEIIDIKITDNYTNIIKQELKTAIMTFASDILSWYIGSQEADIYFCPERFGTMFGSFYMKDAPAVGNAGYNISTSLTSNGGEEFLKILTSEQQQRILSILPENSILLNKIVILRTQIVKKLRNSLSNNEIDTNGILQLSKQIGVYDMDINYLFATTFIIINKLLLISQKEQIDNLRFNILNNDTTLLHPSRPYLYATSISI